MAYILTGYTYIFNKNKDDLIKLLANQSINELYQRYNSTNSNVIKEHVLTNGLIKYDPYIRELILEKNNNTSGCN